ncbi:ubiquitin-related domain-containing protein, partial [Mariannaea sp. PMI_226]
DRDRDRGRDRRPRGGRGGGGFKWKDERRGNDDRRRDDRPYRRRSQSPRRRDYGRDRDRDQDRDRDRNRDRPGPSKPKDNDKPAAPVAAPGGEEMIIVHVNDRLGTRASIPCYASDRIKEFKILVAARIGREPHEILLKRQGERPFKDQLSLEDYGVSNGVQLDL